jgi:hypothetical protein
MKLIFVFILPFLIQATIAKRTTQQSLGKSYNKYGRLVYTEKHTITYEDKKIVALETQYYDLKESNFAYLKSDFSKNIGVPTYEFLDRRFGRADGTKLSQDAKSVLVYGKQNKDDKKQVKSFPVTSDLITGQGLYAYLKVNLKKLTEQKKPTEIKFLIPMKRTYYSFRIGIKELTDKKVKFRVEIDNFFARLVAPSLDITYDRKNSNLLVFEGPSNILDKKQKMRKVKIVYEYPNS